MARMAPAKRRIPQIKLPNLKTGELVATKYHVVSKLSKGVFRPTFKVKDGEKNLYMLKIESLQMKTNFLANTLSVLQQFANTKHFCKLYSSGKTSEFTYIVTTYLGKSIEDLRKARKQEQHFTLSTALRVGVQCLEAIEAMHRHGYIHGDVKPASFAVGQKEKDEQKIVFILNFRFSQKFSAPSADGKKAASTKVYRPFSRNNSKCSPVNLHKNLEPEPKDDVEAWLYQQTLITKGVLLWQLLKTNATVLKSKEQIRLPGHTSRLIMFTSVPEEYEKIFDYTISIEKSAAVDFAKIYQLLQEIMKKNEVTDGQMFDWETAPASSENKESSNSMPTVKKKVAQ